MSNEGNIEELPIQRRHRRQYNHFAPRVTSQFAALLRTKLGLDLRIGTYVQGDIIEQLGRLE